MRIRRNALLLTVATAAAAMLVASGAWASGEPLPGADYVWAQPDASLVGVTCAEPSMPSRSVASMVPDSGYVWAQPGASLVGVTCAEPNMPSRSVASMVPDNGYVWAQPDASLVGVTCAEPMG
jgi:hypothetical protein